MHQLTERSTKDAAAVKILTVITLVYLPTALVAVRVPYSIRGASADYAKNFFSTEFVQTSDSGSMQVTNNVWLLAAIAVPFTLFTLFLWAGWVHFTKVIPPPENDRPNTLPAILRRRQSSFKSVLSSTRRRLPSSPKLPHTNSFRSLFSVKKTVRPSDLESGLVVTEKTTPPGGSQAGGSEHL